jgi:hypothetical protein
MAISSSTTTMITSAVNNWNSAHPNSPQINVDTMVGIAVTESSGNENVAPHLNTNGTTDYGLFQLNSGTFSNASTMNSATNTTTAVAYYGNLLSACGGDTNRAVASYHSGYTGVQGELAKTGTLTEETQGYVNRVNQNSGGLVPGTATSNAIAALPDLPRDAANFVPLVGSDVSSDVYNSLFPDIVVKEGLDTTPWYSDKTLLTGNPRLRQEVQPVSFTILLEDFTLSTSGRPSTNSKPVELQLNASMKSHNLSMKHIFHNQRTRTAFHITMWGMQADTIEGSCTTGVFMNQFGLTDFFSTLNLDPDMQALVTGGMTYKESPITTPTNTNTGIGAGGLTSGVVSTWQTGTDSDYLTRLANLKTTQTSAFRVAAQDAFQEFLSLFKMNGNVWLWNKLYESNVGETRDWTGIQAWSPQVGLSSSQENGRNNDVFTRGSVVMHFRNFAYEGYFKTLQWTMDAGSPFKWDFNFIFQVERTIGRLPVPRNP